MRCLSLLATIACMSMTPFAAAAFHPLTPIGAQHGRIADAQIAADTSGNPRVVFATGGQIRHASGFDGFQREAAIAASGFVYDLPTLATNATGVSFLAFRSTAAAGSRELLWTSNPGGQFKPALSIPGSSHAGLGQATVRVFPDGEVFIGWHVMEGVSGTVLYSRSGGTARTIGTGTEAHFDVDAAGNIHAVFIRNGDVFYTTNKGGDFAANEVELTNSPARESAPLVAVAADGFPFVAYRAGESSRQELYLTAGDFSVHQKISAAAAWWRSVALRSSRAARAYTLIFAGDDAVWILRGFWGGPALKEAAFGLAGNEELVDGALDATGFAHVIALGAGRLSYTNEAPSPLAAFSAAPVRGTVPLTVEFEDLSSGHILEREWDFGDGARAYEANPTHTYEVEGTYTVTLKVTGTAAAMSESTQRDSIVVDPKRDHLYVRNARAYAGERVKVPVAATNERALHAYQLAGRYDGSSLEPAPGESLFDFGLTAVDKIEPEFFAGRQYPEEDAFTLGVIFDLVPPYEGKLVPPSRQINIVNLVFDIRPGVANRTTAFIRLEDGIGDPPRANTFTVLETVSVRPQLHPGGVTILRRDVEPQGEPFVRGDANGDGKTSIADAIFVLGYVFARGPRPWCLDVADVNDSGTVNVADAIGILSLIFTFPYSLEFPFPGPGLDPTDDALPPCSR